MTPAEKDAFIKELVQIINRYAGDTGYVLVETAKLNEVVVLAAKLGARAPAPMQNVFDFPGTSPQPPFVAT